MAENLGTGQVATFPTEVGVDSATHFVKNGTSYRLMRFNEDTWLIHRAGSEREQFELILTPLGGRHWDVEGRGHLGPIVATDVSEALLFSKLF